MVRGRRILPQRRSEVGYSRLGRSEMTTSCPTWVGRRRRRRRGCQSRRGKRESRQSIPSLSCPGGLSCSIRSYKYRFNRAVSPADSLRSSSVFTGKPVQPQTARQLAAAASKARKAEPDDRSDESSHDDAGTLICFSQLSMSITVLRSERTRRNWLEPRRRYRRLSHRR